MTDRNGTPTAPGSDPGHGFSGQAVPSPTPSGPHTSAGRSELGGRVAAHDDTSATEPSGAGRSGSATISRDEYERMRRIAEDEHRKHIALAMAVGELVRFFLVENAEHINGAATVDGGYKVWVNGEKGYLSSGTADVIAEVLGSGSEATP